MKSIFNKLTLFTMFTVVAAMAMSVTAQVQPYRVTDNQVRTLMSRIETRTDTFRRQIDRYENRNSTEFRQQIQAYVNDFENATDSLASNFTSRRSTARDVEEVLGRAAVIDGFMRSSTVNRATRNQWNLIRSDLNILAGYYRVSWNWNNVPTYPSPNSQVYTVSDTQLQALLRRIENRTDTFKRQIDRFDDRRDTRLSGQLAAFVSEFESATNNLNTNFTSRRSTARDVEEVLGRATVIDSFMRNNQVNNAAQTQWNLVRTDLNTLANYYRVSWNWSNVPTFPTNPNSPIYTGSDAQVQALLRRIETRTDTFRQQVERINNRRDTQRTEQFATYVTDFENATDRLSTNFTSRRSTTGDVEEVLGRATVIDQYMRSNRFNNAAESQWNLLRTDLNTLANYYRVSWNWTTVPTFPGNTTNYPSGIDARMTGTYRLNTSLSDNVNTVIERAVLTIGNNANQRDRIRRNLERRLIAPEMFVIEKRGQEIIMASSMSQQVSFSADGVARTETNANGRSVQIRPSISNNELTINYEGDRMNDYYVSFMPMNNGQLRVTRRVYLENRNETVTVNSVYDKVDQIARWNNINYQNNTYSNTNPNNYPTNGNVNNEFIIANNTQLLAVLDTPLSTKSFRDGDRFSMTVTSPSQYQGAVIEGRVNGTKSGVVSGRANLTLDFDTIRLRNGSTYRFAGIVDQVREPDGDVVSVNNEGTVRDSNQTKKTVTRAGIGAALGAIIGAIAGGGSGAAIGAGIGAGAGAGSVVLQGRDNLELPSGTQFTVTATAPYNR